MFETKGLDIFNFGNTSMIEQMPNVRGPIIDVAIDSFPLFDSFPPEIKAMILKACTPIDRVCLSLASKNLYALADKPSVSLAAQDQGPLCGVSEPEDGQHNPWQWRYRHRQQCHALCWEEYNKRREQQGLPPRALKKCRTSRYSSRHLNTHCECFSSKYRLHSRLRKWMPKTLHYCGECDKFTRRKRQHNGKCYHGRSKRRVYEGNNWTHSSRGGAFGHGLWKKHFNNQAMNKLEHRLEKGTTSRAGDSRYSLRDLKPREVDTKDIRDNHSRKFMYCSSFRVGW